MDDGKYNHGDPVQHSGKNTLFVTIQKILIMRSNIQRGYICLTLITYIFQNRFKYTIYLTETYHLLAIYEIGKQLVQPAVYSHDVQIQTTQDISSIADKQPYAT